MSTSLPKQIFFQKLVPEAKMPVKAHSTDAAFDLYSVQEISIPARTRVKISLGFAMGLPVGYCAVIKDRSGMALKHGIYTRAGVIDSDYRGEVCVVAENGTDQPFQVDVGMKIAQMLVVPVPPMVFQEVESLDETTRGEGGFGSTGMH